MVPLHLLVSLSFAQSVPPFLILWTPFQILDLGVIRFWFLSTRSPFSVLGLFSICFVLLYRSAKSWYARQRFNHCFFVIPKTANDIAKLRLVFYRATSRGNASMIKIVVDSAHPDKAPLHPTVSKPKSKLVEMLATGGPSGDCSPDGRASSSTPLKAAFSLDNTTQVIPVGESRLQTTGRMGVNKHSSGSLSHIGKGSNTSTKKSK